MTKQPKLADREAPEIAVARLEELLVGGAVLSYDRTMVGIRRDDLRTALRLILRLRTQLEAIAENEGEPSAAETARFALAMFSRGFGE